MTVSTPYFDLVFQTKELRAQRIVGLTDNIAAAEQRIELLQSRPVTERRARRIARIEAKNSNRLERIDAIEDEIIAYEAILPKDEFEFEYWLNDEGQRYGIKVTVTDSPYDDTYVGGTDADLNLRGTDRRTQYGTSGFNHRRGGIMSGDWAPIDDSRTVGFASQQDTDRYTEYPNLTVSLLESSTNRTIWELELKKDGVDLITETPII